MLPSGLMAHLESVKFKDCPVHFGVKEYVSALYKKYLKGSGKKGEYTVGGFHYKTSEVKVQGNVHTNKEVQSVGNITHKTQAPVKKTNISTKKTTTDTENSGKSKKGYFKGINDNQTNTNKINLCEMKKNEHVKQVTSFHETNKNTKMKRKEIDSAANTMILMTIKFQLIVKFHKLVMKQIKNIKKQQTVEVIIQNK